LVKEALRTVPNIVGQVRELAEKTVAKPLASMVEKPALKPVLNDEAIPKA
jgi:hypothetical protein